MTLTEHFLAHRERIAALAVLAAMALLVLALILPVAGLLAKPQNDITREVRLVSAYRATSATRPALEKDLHALEARAASLPGLAQGDSPALAAAQIQNDLRSIIDAAGGTIHSSQSLPPKQSGTYEDVPLSYSLAIPLDKIEDVLYAVETHSLSLRLSDLHIQVPEGLAPKAVPAPGTLAEIEWTVTATRYAGAK